MFFHQCGFSASSYLLEFLKNKTFGLYHMAYLKLSPATYFTEYSYRIISSGYCTIPDSSGPVQYPFLILIYHNLFLACLYLVKAVGVLLAEPKSFRNSDALVTFRFSERCGASVLNDSTYRRLCSFNGSFSLLKGKARFPHRER